MSPTLGWLRRQLAGIVSLVVLFTMFAFGQLPSVSSEDERQMAAQYEFSPMAIAMPPGLPTQSIRQVNQDFAHISGWVSSVGAGIAMSDLDGDGLANDLCVSEPRFDEVIVTPAPEEGTPRYEPFVLDPGPLPVDETMAPMGCVPGDFNADGRMDLLVYYWGRTPIIWLAREDATGLGPDTFHPVEMVDGVSSDGDYHGPLWNTNTVAVADFDGDGYEDIYVGNYWPHGPVLDPTRSGDVAMPASLSYALNGGESYIYRWTGGESGVEPSVSYELAPDALPDEVGPGWALGASAIDIDGDLLPELYIAHDFGPDRLLHNRSTPGSIEFESVRGPREPMVPRSKILGRSSFKGMGVDFGDMTGNGIPDIFVSNITTSYGIQESNFAFVANSDDQQRLREQLLDGVAPYDDESAPWNVAWTGWGWDTKIADMNNSGQAEILQATGFVQGRTNRWPQLQEMATTNDDLVDNPWFWPNVREGDDIAGDQTMVFFAKGPDGHFVDLSSRLGLAVPVPTRGIGLGDAYGDGRLDFAIARQWEPPMFYRNESAPDHEFLGLRLTHEHDDPQVPGSPVVGAQARVTTADGRTLHGWVDGGGGHSGKRSHHLMIGLGDLTGPLEVELVWRDRDGQPRQEVIELEPGWHDLRLGEQARQVERTQEGTS